jgi:hypothetical protein
VSAVDEGFAQVELASRDEIVGERLQNLVQSLRFAPILKATVACRRRRISVRQIGPRRTSAQHPENAVEHVAWITPRTTATVIANLWLGKKRLDCSPLLVGQIHRDFRSRSGSVVDRCEIRLNLRDLRERHLWDAL